MDDVKLTSKCQLTIPKSVRETLGVGPGDTVRFVNFGGRIHVVRPKSIAELAGMFAHKVTRPTTIEEMNVAISEGAAYGEPDE